MGKQGKLLRKILQGRADANKAKPYQVRQVRAVILRYGLGDLTDA